MMPQRVVRDTVVDRSFTSGYDWSRTPGLALRADNNGYLRFNLAGREKEGMLEAGSATCARYADLVCESFKSLRTSEGAPIVKDVYCAAEQFPGKRAQHLPDLIVTWTGVEPASRADSTFGTLIAHLDTGRGGNHRSQGFQILLRPGVERAGTAGLLSVAELAPMILRAFNNNLSLTN